MGFTESQTKAIVLAPKITAFLSAIASSWIVWQVVRDKRKHTSAYHRIVFGLSCWDVWFSLSCFLSSWPMPVGSQFYAIGNRATCTLQGWSQVVSLATIFYSSLQAAYYLATIRYGLSERTFHLKYERGCHAVANLIPLALATPGLIPGLDLYNPSGPWCFIAPYPRDCIQSYENKGPTTCERGDNSYLYRFGLFYVPLWLGILFNVLAMALIYNKSRAVAHQAFFYILAFFLTWTLPTINRMLAFAGISSFGVTMGHVLSSPSQGICNFLCYIRPRYLRRLRDIRKLQQQQQQGTTTSHTTSSSSSRGHRLSSFMFLGGRQSGLVTSVMTMSGLSIMSSFRNTTTTTNLDNETIRAGQEDHNPPLAPEDDGESSSFFNKCQAMYQTLQTLGHLEQDDFEDDAVDPVTDHNNDLDLDDNNEPSSPHVQEETEVEITS